MAVHSRVHAPVSFQVLCGEVKLLEIDTYVYTTMTTFLFRTEYWVEIELSFSGLAQRSISLSNSCNVHQTLQGYPRGSLPSHSVHRNKGGLLVPYLRLL